MATLADLPPIPEGWGDGFAWVEDARGWAPVRRWGHYGWQLGDWPTFIVLVTSVHAGPRLIYGVATYLHGDVSVAAFDSEEEAIHEVDLVAADYWRSMPFPPSALPDGEGPFERHLCGPYTSKRVGAPTVFDGTEAIGI